MVYRVHWLEGCVTNLPNSPGIYHSISPVMLSKVNSQSLPSSSSPSVPPPQDLSPQTNKTSHRCSLWVYFSLPSAYSKVSGHRHTHLSPGPPYPTSQSTELSSAKSTGSFCTGFQNYKPRPLSNYEMWRADALSLTPNGGRVPLHLWRIGARL